MQFLGPGANDLDVHETELLDRTLEEVHAPLHRLNEGDVDVLACDGDHEPGQARTRANIRE